MTPPSGKEFCSFLERNGWILARVKGSHHIYENGLHPVVVPVHDNKPLKKGTFHALLKGTGLTWK